MKLRISENDNRYFRHRMSKRMNEERRSQLLPQYDSRKSFYGKSHIVEDDDGSQILYSYDTPVCKITNKGDVELLSQWDSSQTTLLHVKEFLKQNGFDATSKAQIAKTYGRAVESRRRFRSRRINEETMWNKVEPSAVQTVRKILMKNSIDILKFEERETMSDTLDNTEISYVTVFVTDIPCYDVFDKKPGNLQRVLDKIRDAVGSRYNVIAIHSDLDTWEIQISKYFG